MSGLFGSAATASSANTVGDLKNDVAVANLPEDGITSLAFNPNPADQKDFMAVASWDKKVRIYEVDTNSGQAVGRAAYDHTGPVFSVQVFKVRFLSLFIWRPLMDLSFRAIRSDHFRPGRCQCSLRWRGQPSQIDGPKHAADKTGRTTREADTISPMRRDQRPAHANYWLMGQDHQVLGSPDRQPRRREGLPRARL